VCISGAWCDDLGVVLHRTQERNPASCCSDNGRLQRTDDGQPDAELFLLGLLNSPAVVYRIFHPGATEGGFELSSVK